MPDPNNPDAQAPPEDLEAVREASYEEPKPLITEEEASQDAAEKSSIQNAMENATLGYLDQVLATAAAAGGEAPLKTYPISDKMRARLLSEFTYHAPQQDQIPRYSALRSMALTFATMVVELTPPSREQSLALTKIGEAVMHANAAIARYEAVPF